jgi:hypothetical protein
MALPIPKRIKAAIAPGMSSWNRTVRNVNQSMTEHLGGADFVSVPESLIIRRVAVFEAELILMEQRIAVDRHAGKEPDEKYLDLYSRLANGQRRFLESVGMKRLPRDVTPSLSAYIEAKKVTE